MKYKLTFALVALMQTTAFAAFQAPLPEFKNEKQLAEWRAEKASEATSQGNAVEETAFYTGKPYLASSGGYAFKYRSYNPEFARWTSEDPSGFPDGANGSSYAPIPTKDIDVAGLLKWSTLINTNTFHSWSPAAGLGLKAEIWTVKTNDESATITLWKNAKVLIGTLPDGADYSYNCHGYTFGNSQYWIDAQVDAIIQGDGYKKINGNDKTGAKIASWGGNTHTAKVTGFSGQNVSEVEGKRGGDALFKSAPGDQGYAGTISYYE